MNNTERGFLNRQQDGIVLNKNLAITSCLFFYLQVVEKKNYDTTDKDSILNESFIPYAKQEEYETAKRRKAILMNDEEKFRIFCKMLKRGIMFKHAEIAHSKTAK